MLKILLFLLFTISLNAQNLRGTSEFKINDEDGSSSFHQNSPILFLTDDSNYIVEWQDFREGTRETYYQKIDNNLNFIGSNSRTDVVRNFKKFSNYNQYYSIERHCPDNNFMVACGLTFEKVINDEIVNDSVYASYFGSECGTGYLGHTPEIHVNESEVLVITQMDGPVQFNKFDLDGNQIWEISDTSYNLFSGKFTGVLCDDGNYAIFNLDPNFEEDNINGLISFFDPDGQILAENVWSGLYHINKDINFLTQIEPGLKIIDTGDKYLALAVNPDSMIIRGRSFSRSGEPLGRPTLFNIPGDWPFQEERRVVRNFGVTSTGENEYTIILSIYDYDNGILNYELACNDEGIFSDIFYEDFELEYDLADNLQINNDGSFEVVYEKDDDVYIAKILHLKEIESKKLNDDPPGGNESCFEINPVNQNGFVAVYRDELGTYGKFVSNDGVVGQKKDYDRMLKKYFFSDRTSIATWSIATATGRNAGLHFYNEDFELTDTDTILFNAASGASKIAAGVLSDDKIVVYTIESVTKAMVRIFDKNGVLLKEEDATGFGVGIAINVIPANDGMFYLVNSSRVLKMDGELNPVTGDIITFDDSFRYINNDKFVSLKFDDVHHTIYGYITNIYNGESVYVSCFAESNTGVSFLDGGNNRLLVSYEKNNDIYYNLFDSEGRLIVESAAVCSYPADERYVLNVTSNGEHIMFLWTEISDVTVGSDVFGKIFTYDDLTGIEEKTLPAEFSLAQNYPNPFNPSTTIKFSIANAGNYSLKIFDILGKEAGIIEEGYYKPGSYEVKFNASSLASGVYFYNLKSSDQNLNLTRKMILIK